MLYDKLNILKTIQLLDRALWNGHDLHKMGTLQSHIMIKPYFPLKFHYSDIIMSAMKSQISNDSIVCSN